MDLGALGFGEGIGSVDFFFLIIPLPHEWTTTTEDIKWQHCSIDTTLATGTGQGGLHDTLETPFLSLADAVDSLARGHVTFLKPSPQAPNVAYEVRHEQTQNRQRPSAADGSAL